MRAMGTNSSFLDVIPLLPVINDSGHAPVTHPCSGIPFIRAITLAVSICFSLLFILATLATGFYHASETAPLNDRST